MIRKRESLGRKFLTMTMAGISLACLGAAVVAAPVPVLPIPAIDVAHLPQILQRIAFSQEAPAAPEPKLITGRSVAKVASRYAPLGEGPSLRLSRAGHGNEEDCVTISQVTGPDGRIYVTRGLVCAE